MPTSDDEPLSWDAMVVVGRVARAHGNKGAVIVNVETDFPEERFQAGNLLYTETGGQIQERVIRAVRFQRGRPVLTLAGVATMDAAEALAGAELRIREADLVVLPVGSFYHHQLVGCTVRTEQGGVVGSVTGVEGTSGAYRLLVLRSDGTGDQFEVPLAEAICTRIDLQDRVVVVDLPEGLIDLNRRR